MAAIDDLKKNDAELESAVNDMLADYRSQSAALADATAKLMDGLNGAPDVDIVAAATKAHDLAQRLRDGMAGAHTSSVGATTANAGTSVVQGGSTTGPDVVSASSPGVIVPPPSGTEASNEVPSSLGGGAMPATSATDGSTSEKAPGEPVPSTKEGEDPKPAEPAVPSVEDVPSNLTDTQPESAKKG